MRCAFIENVTICEPVYVLDAAFINHISNAISHQLQCLDLRAVSL